MREDMSMEEYEKEIRRRAALRWLTRYRTLKRAKKAKYTMVEYCDRAARRFARTG